MAKRGAKKRASQSSRRAGYSAAVVVNLFLLFTVNIWPGWDILPFLTQQFEQVIGWVNASLWVSVVANVLFIVLDPEWFKALGDIATTSVGLVAVLKVWDVFPFQFDNDTWRILTRVLLGVGAVGSVIGIIAAVARVLRSVIGPPGSTST